MIATANTPTVVEISAHGALVAHKDEKTWVSWPMLKAAASQRDSELRDLYRGLYAQAEEAMMHLVPNEFRAAEINTNVYGVQARSIDGGWHPVRWFRNANVRADEGMDLYTMRDAIQECSEIRRRRQWPKTNN